MIVAFFVPGRPVTQGSKTRTKHGGMRESAKGWAAWRKVVAQIAMIERRGHCFEGPVYVDAEFRFLRPARAKNSYPSPDVDKLQRAIGDALQAGGVLHDDRQIVRWLDPRKRYCGLDEVPGCMLMIFDTTHRLPDRLPARAL